MPNHMHKCEQTTIKLNRDKQKKEKKQKQKHKKKNLHTVLIIGIKKQISVKKTQQHTLYNKRH